MTQSGYAYILRPQNLHRRGYEALLHDLIRHEDWFGLVWRDSCKAGPGTLEETLAPLLLEERWTDRWPGTRIGPPIGTPDTQTKKFWTRVCTYHADERALEPLLAVESLFHWCQPDWPEDLFFGSDRHGIALATIAHEGDACLLRQRAAAAIGQIVTLERELLEGEAYRIAVGAGGEKPWN